MLVINEEQQMLKTSAKELLKEAGSIENHLRKLRDAKDTQGYDQTLWQQMVEMGLTALTISEAYGGLDFGYTGLGQVMEEMGRTLTASPLISTVLLSTTAINLGGDMTQKESLLPAISEGKLIIAFACDEGKHHNPHNISTVAKGSRGSYVLTGTKTMVVDGHVANKFIVIAKKSDGDIGLFIVNADAEGVKIESNLYMDSRYYSTVSLTDVKVSEHAELETYESGAALLDKTLDIARIGLAAEMLGSIQEAFERTLGYLKEREQFGVVIGKFQALQHRMAILFGEIELCKSVVIKALKAIDADSEDMPRLASLAKAKLGEIYKLASNEGVQMYGGIGMTDDEEIGFFLKRARVVQQLLGDTNFHLDRLAKMKGY
jgi:alkylation response protein AidB-like acyl-CoA dehydrogenase